ncbi:MAG: thioredoxin domain-containing protein, partial [Bacteroidota bacterium]
AIQIATFIENNLISDSGELKRSFKNEKSTISAFSEDYGLLIQSFINLYVVSLDKYWLDRSKQLMNYTIEHFQNKENEMFFYTSKSNSDLIMRKSVVFDKVIPSSNSVLAKNLFILGHYYYDQNFLRMSSQMLSNLIEDIDLAPLNYTNWLDVYLDHSSPFYEIAVSGSNALEKVKILNSNYLPNTAIAGALSEDNLPIMANKYDEKETYIYVCIDGTCKLPVTEINEAMNQIKKR